jgi:putative membrane protein
VVSRHEEDANDGQDGEDVEEDAAMAENRSIGEPDARFTFANERTFLAWIRTALALIVTGVAATQLLPKF